MTAVNAANTLGPAARTISRVVRVLALRPWGRFLVLSALGALLVGVFARDAAVQTLGLGLIPASLWAGALILGVLYAPGATARRWRLILASLMITAAVVGVMGMIDRPAGGVFEDISLGGSVGTAIARTPAQWGFGGPTALELAAASARIALLFSLAAAVLWTRQAAAVSSRVAAATVTAYVLAAAGSVALHRMVSDYLERRRAARGSVAEEFAGQTAAVAADAESGRRPSKSPVDTEPEVYGMVLEEQDEATPLPAPSEAELWTREETAAVAILLEGAQAAVGTGSVASGVTDPAGIPHFDWKRPPMDVLQKGRSGGVTKAEVDATKDLIVGTLSDHGIDVSIDQVRAGPTVTMYGLAPGWGGVSSAQGQSNGARGNKRVRVDTILAREKDLALALASPSLRFEAPIPGASLVGIEVPNANPSTVTLRSAMESDAFTEFERDAALPVALGIANAGEAIFVDLAKMPHLLVAGATGSGKSVCIHSIITGLVMVRTPEQLRLVLIDPKRVELMAYAGLPHLSCPPVLESDEAVAVLKAAVAEMMERFQVLERAGVKNIVSYNEKAITKMPYLVIAVDELADLMLNTANNVERLLVRLAQLGRATGVHLVVATQRPSVDVVTGLIKANFPSRISFGVSSQIDSRTIIDSPGAEKLLGKGDMLFLPIDRAKPIRLQGAFLSDTEVEAVVNFWRVSGGPPMPQLVVPQVPSGEKDSDGASERSGDALFDKAFELAHTQSRLSTSLLQRRLRIGYPRAARLMDELEEAGVVGPGEPGKPRSVIGN